MPDSPRITRRRTLQGLGALGAASVLPGEAAPQREPDALSPSEARARLRARVANTALIDTHEHLLAEAERLAGTAHRRVVCDDWAFLLHHYLGSDLLVAGMPDAAHGAFFSPRTPPAQKWEILAPYWPRVKHTGYGQAVQRAVQQLYDVEELSAATVPAVQSGYEALRRPGFYARVLGEVARITACQVNCLSAPIGPVDPSGRLQQDLSIVGMFAGPDLATFGGPTGIAPQDLGDWHRVIDWWFERYGSRAVAVKSQNAYSRDIDYEPVPAQEAAGPFKRRLAGQSLSAAERKALEDHLFWYAVGKATEYQLPVKLHTGYYAGQNRMPLERVRRNAASACALCRNAPQTRFVFMHIGYPDYEAFLAVAKQYTNAYLDMCWSWIINPVAAQDFLQKALVTVPANKLLCFGGDYIPVEPVVGHAALARQGIAGALIALVDGGWLHPAAALDLVDPLMHGNARALFGGPSQAGAAAPA